LATPNKNLISKTGEKPKIIAHQGARRVGDTWGLDLVRLIDDDFAAVGVESDIDVDQLAHGNTMGRDGGELDKSAIRRSVRLDSDRAGGRRSRRVIHAACAALMRRNLVNSRYIRAQARDDSDIPVATIEGLTP